jgi:hypothetical protein
MADDAIIAFRRIAYDILRAHYDCDKIPASVIDSIPEGKTYAGFTDEAIARQITQMIGIVGTWFGSFDSDDAKEYGDETKVAAVAFMFQILSAMFLEALDSDEEHYKNG